MTEEEWLVDEETKGTKKWCDLDSQLHTLREEVQLLKQKNLSQENEYKKMKAYAKAGKHYKERAKTIKSKLNEAVDEMTRMETKFMTQIEQYKERLRSLHDNSVGISKDKQWLCVFHVRTVQHAVDNLWILHKEDKSRAEMDIISESCLKLMEFIGELNHPW